ncbi:hypothetical protein Tco_0775823 [Tanacetum coccineum]
MTRSSTKELITPFGNPERVFRSKRRLFETHDLVESSSPELGLFSDIEEHSEEETTEIMTETMENFAKILSAVQNMKTQTNTSKKSLRLLTYLKFSDGDIKIINALRFSHVLNWSRKSLAQERTIGFDYKLGNPENKVSKQEVILFYNGLDVPTRQILDSKGAIHIKIVADAKIAIKEMAEYSQKWHNGTSSKARSTETSDGLAAIQA